MAIAPGIRLSPTVEGAVGRLPRSEPVRSWDLVQPILRAHGEYAGGLSARVAFAPGPELGERLLADEWLARLRSLFDPSRVDEIHGRLAILGLARMDRELGRHLASTRLLEGLDEELRESFDSLLLSPGSKRVPEVSPEPGSDEEVPPGGTQMESGPGTGDGGVPRERVVVATGYASDSVAEEALDRLGIEQEVQTIAHLLAARSVKPPLSLGLFGDWGTGKSFFMAKLRAYIRDIAEYSRVEEKRLGVRSDWCTRVLQIEFNAWHYSDANLWATLVSRIYEALGREIQPVETEDEGERKLREDLFRAEAVNREASARLEEAKRRVEQASSDLYRSRSDLHERASRLEGLVGDVRELLGGKPEVATALDEAADALGVPAAARTYQALQDLTDTVGTASGRLTAIGLAVVRSPRTMLLLALLAIVAPAGVSLFLSWEAIPLRLSQSAQRLVEISTALTGVLIWLQTQVGRGIGYVQAVERALADATAARTRRIESEPEVMEAVREVTRSEAAEEAARQNLEHSQAELQRLSAELSETAPERKLFRLLEERSRAATYTQHLGIISLIREDFDTISRLLARQEREPFDPSREQPPIQRIILYIDDLDRCPPERVVQVLEAVHMLLAFPLFTVVVGVDPRWLRESLARVHSSILSADHAEGRSSAGFSTPQDYLEKIFQIPFALRRVEKDGYLNLVADLVRPDAGAAPAQPSPAGGAEPARRVRIGIDAVVGEGESIPRDSSQPIPGEPDEATPEAAVDPRGREESMPFTPLRARQLEFTPQEKRDIDLLWPLFTTPRTVKRFVNTYRLLRAGIPDTQLASFEGTAERPGRYQVALLLLAIVSSAPNETEAFKSCLLRWALEPDAEDPPRSWTWMDLIDDLSPEVARFHADWADIDTSVRLALRGGFDEPFTRGEILHWIPRVGRFTFTVLEPRAWSIPARQELARSGTSDLGGGGGERLERMKAEGQSAGAAPEVFGRGHPRERERFPGA